MTLSKNNILNEDRFHFMRWCPSNFSIFAFSIRGRLGSFTPLARNFGVLIGYIVGAVVEYEHRSYIFVFFPIMYVIWLYALPNTPQYYMHRENYSVSKCEFVSNQGHSLSPSFLVVRKPKLLSCITKAAVE